MAYEVHARFWMQPHLLVCAAAGVGAAAALDGVDRGGAVLLGGRVGAIRGAAASVAIILALARVEALYGELDFSTRGLAMKAHGTAVLNAVPAESLLLSHTDLHWNPSRYLRSCEAARPDVAHASLQLLPYPWFERQKRLYPNVTFPPIPARASTDVKTEAYEALLEATLAANLNFFPGGVYVDIHGVYEPRLGSVGRWRSLALVPWGLNFRAFAPEDVAGDVVAVVDGSLAEIERLRATWAAVGGPPDPQFFRAGTWELGARATYNDAHYQCGLFLLGLAQELRSSIDAARFPFYLKVLRSAFALTSASSAEAPAHLTSPRGDAAKNALLAAVLLHGALAAGAAISAKMPGAFGRGDLGPPGDGELAAVTVDASARAAAFLEEYPDDKDASVFAAFLEQTRASRA